MRYMYTDTIRMRTDPRTKTSALISKEYTVTIFWYKKNTIKMAIAEAKSLSLGTVSVYMLPRPVFTYAYLQGKLVDPKTYLCQI